MKNNGHLPAKPNNTDIEAWYSAAQLRDVLAAMQAAQAAEGTTER